MYLVGVLKQKRGLKPLTKGFKFAIIRVEKEKVP